MSVNLSLVVEGNNVSAAVQEQRCNLSWIGNHQMDINGQLRGLFTVRENIWTKRDIRNKVTIHHVVMDVISICNGIKLALKLGKICR